MLKGLLFSETERLMDRLGEKPGRAEVLAGWLYHDGRLIRDVAETGGDDGGRPRQMGKKTREKIASIATADGGLRLEVSGERLLVAYCCKRIVWLGACGVRAKTLLGGLAAGVLGTAHAPRNMPAGQRGYATPHLQQYMHDKYVAVLVARSRKACGRKTCRGSSSYEEMLDDPQVVSHQ